MRTKLKMPEPFSWRGNCVNANDLRFCSFCSYSITLFDRYTLINPATQSHDPFVNDPQYNNLRNAVADVHGTPPRITNFPTKAATARRIRPLHPRSPHDTPSRFLCYIPYQQQATNFSSQRVQSTSPKRDLTKRDLVTKAVFCTPHSTATASFAPRYALAITSP